MIQEIMMKAHAVRKADILKRLARSKACAIAREQGGIPMRKPRSEVRELELTQDEFVIIEDYLKNGYKLAMVKMNENAPPTVEF